MKKGLLPIPYRLNSLGIFYSLHAFALRRVAQVKGLYLILIVNFILFSKI